MTTAAETLDIEYEGISAAGELWGGTEANFMVRRTVSGGAKEAAVLVNAAALEYLAEQLGQENTQDFREGAARFIGREVIRTTWERFGRIDGRTLLSAADVRENPHWLDVARAALAVRAAETAVEPEAESAMDGHH